MNGKKYALILGVANDLGDYQLVREAVNQQIAINADKNVGPAGSLRTTDQR